MAIAEPRGPRRLTPAGRPLEDLREALQGVGVGPHLAPAVFAAFHRRPVAPEAEWQDVLAADPRIGPKNAHRLAIHTDLTRPRISARHPAPDGTERLVVRLSDGAEVETVMIPMKPGRLALCVSSQVGCAMGCTFCATGTLGLARGLDAAEIAGQYHLAASLAASRGDRITHVVFMGMGEPLHHYEATRDAVRVLLDPHGPCLAARRVTVSTVGLVPRMRTFARDFGGRVQLALSLHAGTDDTRRALIPLAARYDLATLRATLDDHPLPGSRCLMLEYAVLPGVNDGPADIEGLARFTDGLRCLVNLIPWNPFPGAAFRSPTPAEVHALAAALADRRVPASIRTPRGRGVDGACGQLALRGGSAA